MSPLDYIGIFFAAWFALSCLAAAWWCLAASRRIAQPPEPDPDSTADDPDDEPFTDADGTRWLPVLPPVPPATRRPDLEGYRLDAKFFAVLAPSFREYH